METVMKGYTCERCDYKWTPRKQGNIPKVCAKCHSKLYNVPKRKKEELSPKEQKLEDEIETHAYKRTVGKMVICSDCGSEVDTYHELKYKKDGVIYACERCFVLSPTRKYPDDPKYLIMTDLVV